MWLRPAASGPSLRLVPFQERERKAPTFSLGLDYLG